MKCRSRLEIRDSKVQHRKGEFKNYLMQQGLKPSLSARSIEDKLSKIMGKIRYTEYCDAADAARAGDSIGSVYGSARTLAEGNLLFSHQGEVLAESGYALYEAIEPSLRNGKRVADLGCGTGLLASFIAKTHLECQVVGFDRHRGWTTEAQSRYGLHNLTIEECDHSQPPQKHLRGFDVLICSLGIDFDRSASRFGVDANSSRHSESYASKKAEARVFFQAWGDLAVEGAVLATVLRLPSFPHVLAVIDAAQESGWRVHFPHCRLVRVGKERFPLLYFSREEGEAVPEESVLGWWVEDGLLQLPVDSVVEGDVALALYRALGKRTVTKVLDHRYDDGNVGRREAGIAGAVGYVFGIYSTPHYQFQFLPRSKAPAVRLDDWTGRLWS